MKKKMRKIYDAVNEMLSKANHDEDTKYQEDTATCFHSGRVDAFEDVLSLILKETNEKVPKVEVYNVCKDKETLLWSEVLRG